MSCCPASPVAGSSRPGSLSSRSDTAECGKDKGGEGGEGVNERVLEWVWSGLYVCLFMFLACSYLYGEIHLRSCSLFEYVLALLAFP